MSQQTTPKAPVKKIPKSINFLNGGLSGMFATLIVQPLDLIKNRMQLSGAAGGKPKEAKSTFQVLQIVLKNEGIKGLYNGLSAGLLRQALYTTTRLGVFNSLQDQYSARTSKQPNLFAKIGIGMFAGGVGAIVGSPAEISLIRMTSDGRLPPAERRNYKNVFNALSRIITEEGFFTLWRGVVPTIGRAMVVNAAQLPSYSQAKEFLLSTKYFNDNYGCHFTASTFSGFVTTLVSMPVDIAKTRVQNMKVIDGKPEYRGSIDVIVKVVQREGLFKLWSGFTPYFVRLTPHSIITFMTVEQLNNLYHSIYQ